MLVDSAKVNVIVGLFQRGTISAGDFAKRLVMLCVNSLDDYIFDAISEILPIALTVAGAILVVMLGWRLFRNFTRG